MITKLVVASVVALSITACAKQAETTVSVNNNFTVDKLFTRDGCSVFRFNDADTIVITSLAKTLL